MGESKLRAIASAKPLVVDFSKLKLVFMRGDLLAFGLTAKELKAVRDLFYIATQVKFQPDPRGPNLMKGHDRKIWAVWQEVLAETIDNADADAAVIDQSIELPRGHFEWIYKILNDDDLTSPSPFAQWWEATRALLDKQLNAPTVVENFDDEGATAQ